MHIIEMCICILHVMLHLLFALCVLIKKSLLLQNAFVLLPVVIIFLFVFR